MSAKIEYNGNVVATVDINKTATLPVKDLKMATHIKVTAEKDSGYNNTDGVDATRSQVLAGKKFYGLSGMDTGTMEDNGYTNGDSIIELDARYPSSTLNGAYRGTAKITLEEKTITENGTYNASSGKVISKVTVAIPEVPEYTEVADFRVFSDEADEGVAELAYDSSKDVKLSAGQRVRFFSLEDDNFVPWNIKKGVTIFGMTGSYEESIDSFMEGSLTELVLEEATTIRSYSLWYSTITKLIALKATSIADNAATSSKSLTHIELPKVRSIGASAFSQCSSLQTITFSSEITSIGKDAFWLCTKLADVTFKGTPTSLDSTAFSSCNKLTTINVPWAEGAVSGAPWGATNATINYNYKG